MRISDVIAHQDVRGQKAKEAFLLETFRTTCPARFVKEEEIGDNAGTSFDKMWGGTTLRVILSALF